MPISDDDIREILRIIDESDLSELKIETDGFALHVIRGDRAQTSITPPVPVRERKTSARSEPDAATRESDGALTISAPMLGTFYRAEAPGQPPFVEVGKPVEPDTIVCIIEVMKMMNSVPAGVSGTIAEVIAENAQLVEYGEPLFRVEPA
jgi:acetyl-CoA carboxylase biotin carboxyl carrier protein